MANICGFSLANCQVFRELLANEKPGNFKPNA